MDIYKMREMKNAIRRIESTSKVTGTAQYLDDLEMQGMAYGGIIRSPYPHAKVLSIDFSEVKKMPGVLGTLTPDDVPQVHFNVTGSLKNPSLIEDQSILTWHPLHEGDRICAVVAEDKETLHRALEAVKIEYEVLPASMTIDQSIKEGARIINPEFYQDNFYCHKVGTRGEVEEGFEKSDYIFEGTYRTPTQHPIPMEPVSCIAYWNRDNKLHTWATSQVPYQDRRILAAQFGIPESDVSCHRAMIGGAFGAREEMYHQDVAAALSRLIYRPVKIINNRSDEMTATAVRHASYSKVKMGCTKDGQMVAFHQVMYTNGGSYCTHSPLVTAAPDRKMPYHMPYFRYDGIGVATNAAVSGAFRGYGNTQLTFGREILMDRLAQKLDMDPVEFRLMNHVQVGECFPCASIPVSSNGIEDCARRCQQIQKEIDEKEPLIDDENIRQAWGISFSCHGSGPSSKEGLSGAVVMLNADASVHLLVGSADIGQGSETMESQIAAECLGIPLSSVQITAADTSLTPYNTGTFGSSQTFICGNAVKLACDDLKKKMVEQLKVIYDGCMVKEKDHRYYISGGEELELSFEDAARKILFDPKGSVPIGAGTYKALACPNPFSVCFVKAEYHKKLNAIRLMDIIEVVDVGTPINRLTVAGQLEGGIAQGVGYALYERMEINPRSRRTLSTDFLHYRIPQMGDMPRTYVDMVSSHDPYGPHGAKSVGELATVPVAPAIVNAVRRASGIEINSLPLCDKFAILPTERGYVK